MKIDFPVNIVILFTGPVGGSVLGLDYSPVALPTDTT
jgi:hypothetical protein